MSDLIVPIEAGSQIRAGHPGTLTSHFAHVTSVQRTRYRRGQRPQLAVLDSGVVDEVETDLQMAVDDSGCNEEDE